MSSEEFKPFFNNLILDGVPYTQALFEASLATRYYNEIPPELFSRFNTYLIDRANRESTHASPGQISSNSGGPPLSPFRSRVSSVCSPRTPSGSQALSLDLSDMSCLPSHQSQVNQELLHRKATDHWTKYVAWKREKEKQPKSRPENLRQGEAAAAAASAALRRHTMPLSSFETPYRPRLGVDLSTSPAPPSPPSPRPQLSQAWNPVPMRPFAVPTAATRLYMTPPRPPPGSRHKDLVCEFEAEMKQYQDDWEKFKEAEEEANHRRVALGKRNLRLIELLVSIEALPEGHTD
ncbi:uncharacterized protein LY79DRAFT_707918 [Colletotrichum navitas]|uniref:Uncharacterized protein n=1 Tax=Colletotrichum navitas TaxID=681940 RepID=A0AAD8PKL3_9PEZI|nr:uncharacterized protein LY79DRAFT_707918 [Colletotrichum navitas]KAK1569534.1 hypothetical protein LY79DRAFT_707918 [Colletotrichum navitas]